ncbi:MAG TPA: MATE family efflux transporter, partial [Gemmataceae bacterium]|nr:MATE family efflux transporter [Gemmataceae bacterium]
PERAARTTRLGLALALAYMAAVGLGYVLLPGPLVALFHSDEDPERWGQVAALVPVLLRFVAVYSLFDAMNLTVSFALRGAGDTRFVTAAALALSWPVMVVPTWAAWHFGWGLYWAWVFASLYIALLALTMLLRFRQGKWRTMRVIETPPAAVSPARHQEREREDVRLQ